MSTLKLTLRHLPSFGEAKYNLSKIPLLFIWASKDMVINKPPSDSKDPIIESGHGGIISNPNEIAQAIKTFFG